MVLHVTAIEFSVRTLLAPQLDALLAEGYDVRVACSPDDGGFSPALSRFRPLAIDFPRSLRARQMARSTFEVVRATRALCPRILHLHSPSIALTARFAPRRALPPETRVVRTVHGFLHQWDPPMSRRDRFLDRLEWVLSRRTDALLFQSREDYEQASARGYRSRLIYLGNGVQDAWFELALPERQRPLRLLFVGRLIREKGVLDLMEAVTEVPGVTVTVVGGQARGERFGVEDELLQRVASDRRLGDRVKLLGMLDPAELPGVMARHDAFVLPTYHHEGVPRSVIEAMAAGRPVVATDMRGCRELVRDSVNGYLVPRRDPVKLRAALAKLEGLDGAAFREMCVAARATADASHRESLIIDRLLSAYSDLGVRPET